MYYGDSSPEFLGGSDNANTSFSVSDLPMNLFEKEKYSEQNEPGDISYLIKSVEDCAPIEASYYDSNMSSGTPLDASSPRAAAFTYLYLNPNTHHHIDCDRSAPTNLPKGFQWNGTPISEVKQCNCRKIYVGAAKIHEKGRNAFTDDEKRELKEKLTALYGLVKSDIEFYVVSKSEKTGELRHLETHGPVGSSSIISKASGGRKRPRKNDSSSTGQNSVSDGILNTSANVPPISSTAHIANLSTTGIPVALNRRTIKDILKSIGVDPAKVSIYTDYTLKTIAKAGSDYVKNLIRATELYPFVKEGFIKGYIIPIDGEEADSEIQQRDERRGIILRLSYTPHDETRLTLHDFSIKRTYLQGKVLEMDILQTMRGKYIGCNIARLGIGGIQFIAVDVLARPVKRSSYPIARPI